MVADLNNRRISARFATFLAIAASIGSASCTDDRFAFRGIVAWESCAAARAAEVAQGSKLLREATPHPNMPNYKLYTYAGALYGSNVEVHLGCLIGPRQDDQTIYDAFYIMKSTDLEAAEAYMTRVIAELKPKYGDPETSPLMLDQRNQLETVGGRKASFGCYGDDRTGYSLDVELVNPRELHENYEVWLSIRFGGGVC